MSQETDLYSQTQIAYARQLMQKHPGIFAAHTATTLEQIESIYRGGEYTEEEYMEAVAKFRSIWALAE